jgi:hypothetical protein
LMRFRRTSGVCPMASRMLLHFIASSGHDERASRAVLAA